MVLYSIESIDQIIEESKETNNKYTDEFFELTPKNVLGTITDSNKNIKIARICEIYKGPLVIGILTYSANNISSQNIIAGQIKNYFFLSAIEILADYPELIKRMLNFTVSTENSAYEIKVILLYSSS